MSYTLSDIKNLTRKLRAYPAGRVRSPALTNAIHNLDVALRVHMNDTKVRYSDIIKRPVKHAILADAISELLKHYTVEEADSLKNGSGISGEKGSRDTPGKTLKTVRGGVVGTLITTNRVVNKDILRKGYVPAVKMDENGSPVLDENGNVQYLKDKKGKLLYVNKEDGSPYDEKKLYSASQAHHGKTKNILKATFLTEMFGLDLSEFDKSSSLGKLERLLKVQGLTREPIYHHKFVPDKVQGTSTLKPGFVQITNDKGQTWYQDAKGNKVKVESATTGAPANKTSNVIEKKIASKKLMKDGYIRAIKTDEDGNPVLDSNGNNIPLFDEDGEALYYNKNNGKLVKKSKAKRGTFGDIFLATFLTETLGLDLKEFSKNSALGKLDRKLKLGLAPDTRTIKVKGSTPTDNNPAPDVGTPPTGGLDFGRERLKVRYSIKAIGIDKYRYYNPKGIECTREQAMVDIDAAGSMAEPYDPKSDTLKQGYSVESLGNGKYRFRNPKGVFCQAHEAVERKQEEKSDNRKPRAKKTKDNLKFRTVFAATFLTDTLGLDLDEFGPDSWFGKLSNTLKSAGWMKGKTKGVDSEGEHSPEDKDSLSSISTGLNKVINAFYQVQNYQKTIADIQTQQADIRERSEEEASLEASTRENPIIPQPSNGGSFGMLADILPDITKQINTLTKALEDQGTDLDNRTESVNRQGRQREQAEQGQTRRSKLKDALKTPRAKTAMKLAGSGMALGAGVYALTKPSQGPNGTQGPSMLSSFLSSASQAGSSFAKGYDEAITGLSPAGNSENASKAMDYFMSQGWNKQQAAAIVGSMQQESGANLNPNAENKLGGGHGAWGIAQWRGDRQLGKYPKEAIGVDTMRGTTFEQQLQYVQWELTHRHKNAGEALRKSKTIEEAVQNFVVIYEGGKGAELMLGKRIANANYLAGDTTFAEKLGLAAGWFEGEAGMAVQEASEYITGAYGKLKDNLGRLFTLGGGVTGNERNLANLHPEFEKRIVAALTEYHDKTGRTPTLTSGFRYPGDQGRISSGSNPKAKEGQSRHQKGQALDFDSQDVAMMNRLGILSKYGLVGGIASGGGVYHSDPPHVEMAGGVLPPTPQQAQVPHPAFAMYNPNSLLLMSNANAARMGTLGKTKYIPVPWSMAPTKRGPQPPTSAPQPPKAKSQSWYERAKHYFF